MEGWEPNGETGQWITDCLRDRVDPLPPFEVKTWTLENGRSLTIVRVWPASVPPCITVEGYVYERIGTTTAQVTDAGSLHRLIDRGSASRQRAWQESQAGRDDMGIRQPSSRIHQIALTVGATSLAGDITAIAFRESLARSMLDSLKRRPLVPALPPKVAAETDATALTLWSESGFSSREGYTIRIRRNGSVAVGWSDSDIESGLEAVATSDGRLQSAWKLAAEVLALLDVRGPIHIAVRLSDLKKGRNTDIDRWSTTEDPPATLFESIQREARRATGRFDWEPELGGGSISDW